MGSMDNVYIADRQASVVWKLDRDATPSLVRVAGTGVPGSVVDDDETGTVVGVVGELGYNDDNIPATEALLSSPAGVAAFGNTFFIADTENNLVRKVNGGDHQHYRGPSRHYSRDNARDANGVGRASRRGARLPGQRLHRRHHEPAHPQGR